jgi:hypothetical protein
VFSNPSVACSERACSEQRIVVSESVKAWGGEVPTRDAEAL